jgi:FkbH-like protein
MEDRPDYFLCEIYNPNTETLSVSLVMRNGAQNAITVPFQQLLPVQAGFNRFKIDFTEISECVDVETDLRITITPNIVEKEQEGLVLYFGTIAFVKDLKYQRPDTVAESPACKTVKIVAWDLDNTVWSGVLVEDGAENLVLRPGVEEAIKTFDQRGIVNTVISKNDHDFAMAQLQRFGIAEYFVFPKISWGPKSESMKALIREFNVGEDTFAFIDDSPFERAEVSNALARVRIFEETEIDGLLQRKEFNPAASSESSRRRHFYQTQKKRNDAQTQFDGDYLNFLSESKIRLLIESGSEGTLDRTHELVQRTNQMNFSGTRYSRNEISSILLNHDSYDCFCLSCEDKYGSYGMIGFAVVGWQGEIPNLQDFAMSCRVQSKRVEHAILSFLLNRYQEMGCEHFFATYRQTDRNRQCAKVFSDLGFVTHIQNSDEYTYAFDLALEVPDDQLISVEDGTKQ